MFLSIYRAAWATVKDSLECHSRRRANRKDLAKLKEVLEGS
jgi:hypothetical protein